MRIGYLDCFSGISGDMFLGALVDAGVRLELLQETATGLKLDATIVASCVERAGIRATKVDVSVGGEIDHYEPALSHAVGFAREELRQPVATARGRSLGRTFAEMQAAIAAAPISETASHRATLMLRALAGAEARIHNVECDTIRFHEIAAADVLVDFICASVGAESLHVDQWLGSSINVGGGVVKQHDSRFPIPAPVALELLKDVPVHSCGVDAEMVTPTGAAIVRTLCGDHFGPIPPMIINTVAYGAGSRDFAGFANVLRLLVGKCADTPV